jgi:hypothetical protein
MSVAGTKRTCQLIRRMYATRTSRDGRDMPKLPKLPRVNPVRKRLADGTIKEYRYLGRAKGAVPLCTDDADALIASYSEAQARKITPPAGVRVLSDLVRMFESSTDFTVKLSPRSQADYRKQFKPINAEFGDFPLAKLPQARGMFKEWRPSGHFAKPTPRGLRFNAYCRGRSTGN